MSNGSTAVKSEKREAWYSYINQQRNSQQTSQRTTDAVPMCKLTFTDHMSAIKTCRDTMISILPIHNSQLTTPALPSPIPTLNHATTSHLPITRTYHPEHLSPYQSSDRTSAWKNSLLQTHRPYLTTKSRKCMERIPVSTH